MGRRQKDDAPTDPLREAVLRGSVNKVMDRVRVPAKFSPSKVELVQHYERLQAKDIEGALAMCGGDVQRVLYLFNQAYDTAARVPIRHRLVAQAKTPQKALERAAESLVKAGLAKNAQEALERLQTTFSS